MNNSKRFSVYFAGFLAGTLLVSFMMMRRNAADAAAEDPWQTRESRALAGGYEPLPERLPEQLRSGEVLNFGILPESGPPEERVWQLNFRESYPHVRVVEDLETGELSYMAADQVVLELAEGVDPTELSPVLDALGLRLRMFNRRDRIAVLGVLHTGVDAVPETLEALRPWGRLFKRAEPDWIILR